MCVRGEWRADGVLCLTLELGISESNKTLPLLTIPSAGGFIHWYFQPWTFVGMEFTVGTSHLLSCC